MAQGSPAWGERATAPWRSPTEENEGSEDKDEESGKPYLFVSSLASVKSAREDNKKEAATQ
jgi:hypothetical protein